MNPKNIAIRRSYVDLADGQLHIRRTGESRVPLVMLHQTASSGAMFEGMMHVFGGTIAAIAIDTPGFGNSFDPPCPPTMALYVSWVIEALDLLGIDEFHLLGHHTGGCIAVELAVLHPGRVRSLTVFGPVYLTEEKRHELLELPTIVFEPDWSGDYLKRNFEQLVAGAEQNNIELYHREVLDNLRAWNNRAGAYGAVWRSLQVGLFAQVRCPMLLMAAPDDLLAFCLQDALSALPHAQTASISGGDFEPDLDAGNCAAAVMRFIADQAVADVSLVDRRSPV